MTINKLAGAGHNVLTGLAYSVIVVPFLLVGFIVIGIVESFYILLEKLGKR